MQGCLASTFHSNISKCLALRMYKWGITCSIPRRGKAWGPKIFEHFKYINVWYLPESALLRPRTACFAISWYQSLAVRYTEKYWLEYKPYPNHQSAWWTPGKHQMQMLQHSRRYLETCALVIFNTFLSKEEFVLSHTGICCLLLPLNIQDTHHPSDFLLEGSVYLGEAFK